MGALRLTFGVLGLTFEVPELTCGTLGGLGEASGLQKSIFSMSPVALGLILEGLGGHLGALGGSLGGILGALGLIFGASGLIFSILFAKSAFFTKHYVFQRFLMILRCGSKFRKPWSHRKRYF